MRFACYGMRNWNKGLNDRFAMLWYAHYKDLIKTKAPPCTQKSSKHFEVKW